MHDACNIPEGFSSQFFTGVMAFLMGFVTMVRLTRNMPKKLTEATIYSNPLYCVEPIFKDQEPSHQFHDNAISGTQYMSVLKCIHELEDKVSTLSLKPDAMPAEKEEMLNAAVRRVDALEQELMETKKVCMNSHIMHKIKIE